MNRVLILEDEPLIAMDRSMAFEDCAIAAVTAVTCAEASTALAEQAIDGAVLDVNLGGGETCEQIALVLKERAIPFILNTGDLDRSGELLRAIDAPVVAKPTPADRVVERLMEHARTS